MAECKDCAHNKVCAEVNSLKCRKDFIWYDAKSGCPYYTAVVVPKSEVEELKVMLEITNKAYKSLEELYHTDTDALVEARRKTEVGVARTFRKRMNEKMGKHTHLLGKEYVQRIMREVEKELIGEEDAAELKKKYTEEKI